MGFRVLGSRFGFWGFGSSVQGLGSRVQDSGFRVWGLGFRALGSGFRVQGSGFRVQDLGLKIEDLGLGAWGLGLRGDPVEKRDEQVELLCSPVYELSEERGATKLYNFWLYRGSQWGRNRGSRGGRKGVKNSAKSRMGSEWLRGDPVEIRDQQVGLLGRPVIQHFLVLWFRRRECV